MTEEKEIKEVLAMIVGRASLCWEPRPTGVFDTKEAEETVKMGFDMLSKYLDKWSVNEYQEKIASLEKTVNLPEHIEILKEAFERDWKANFEKLEEKVAKLESENTMLRGEL